MKRIITSIALVGVLVVLAGCCGSYYGCGGCSTCGLQMSSCGSYCSYGFGYGYGYNDWY